MIDLLNLCIMGLTSLFTIPSYGEIILAGVILAVITYLVDFVKGV